MRWAHRIMAGFAAAWCLICAASAFAAPAPPPSLTRTGDAFYPAYARLVLETQDLGGQDVAAWTWDDKYVVTASAIGRTVLVWDVATGLIVNKIAFPTLSSGDFVEPYELTVDRAGLMVLRANLRSNEASFCRNAEFRYPLAKAGVWNNKIDPDTSAPCLDDGSDSEFPKSHDGRLSLKSSDTFGDPGLRVIDAAGRTVRTLRKPPPLSFRHAALSPDGRTMALILDEAPVGVIGLFATQAGLPAASETKLLFFDIATSTYLKPVTRPGFYSRVAWLDAKRVLLTENYGSNARAVQDAAPAGRAPTPALIIDTTTGKDGAPPIGDHCYIVPLSGDALVGAGLANCWDDPKREHGVMRYDPGSGWRTLDEADFKGRTVTRIAPSPDGTRVAALAETSTGTAAVELLLLDAATGAVVARTPLPDYETSAQLAYSPDGKAVVATLDGRYQVWTPGSPPAELAAGKPPPLAFIQSSVELLGHWYEFHDLDQQLVSIDLRENALRSTLMFGNVVAAGLMPDAPVFWAVTSIDGIKFFPASLNAGSGRFATISTWLIAGDHYFTLSPDRRYDTDLGGDTDQFRWLVTDSGFEPLGPQTFMRDYFEPRLAPRALACIRADTCGTAFKPIPTVALLNRASPKVTIAKVSAGPTPDIAIVDIVALPGHKPDAKYGKTDSPVYDLRLFRNGSLVARAPASGSDPAVFELTTWRAANLVPAGPDGAAHVRLTVKLPTGAAVRDTVFTAYAFNEDRIKSETFTYKYTRPAMTPVPPRAFVVTIGIDAYDDPRLTLHFSARDAELIAERLRAIPGFAAQDVHQLVLTGRMGANGKPSRVLRGTVAAALGILGGQPRESALKTLAAAGFDGSALDAARPDDTVIVSFAGHGWADKQGGFFLIPSDSRAIDPAKPVDTSRFVSAIDLTDWLRPIDAGEIALIIDACNSAASVDAGGFRPGPMGDANLGQLAFDKGIRILAATQSADLALEDDRLGHGLLTYALADEGIDDSFGRADSNGDGAITLDEWLRYATARLPGLSEDVRLKRYASLAARDFDLVPLVPTAKPKPQEPALFDFTGRPSAIVLRRRTP